MTSSIFRGGKTLAATVFALGMLTTASFAYTQEQQQLCSGDAMRLCSSEIPDVERVTACMVAKKSQLSPPCRAQFRSGPEPSRAAAAPAGRPMAIKPAPRKSAAKARKPKKPAKPART